MGCVQRRFHFVPLTMQSPTPGPFRFDAVHSDDVGGEHVLDEATFGALQELAGDDDPDLVADLVGLFLGDSRERMDEIAAARSSSDAATIGRAAHALKSSSANIGALAFSGVCADLEREARAEGASAEALIALIDRAIAMYTDVCAALGGAE